MKTIYTSLPIYDRIEKQCFERGKKGGVDRPVPIKCPRHRLPSFQWLDGADGSDHVDQVDMITRDGTTTDITTYFVTLPSSHAITSDVYFSYEGDTLKWLLAEGIYYLKITMNNGYIYYSEWFHVTCVYPNLITSWTNGGFNTFASTGTTITSAVESTSTGSCDSDDLSVEKGKPIKLYFYLTLNSGTLPNIYIINDVPALISNQVTLVEGLNEITLTPTSTYATAEIRIYAGATVNFSLTEVLVNRGFSDKYLTINFYNTCDLGDILYHDGFDQTVWFESEAMEPLFTLEEEGSKNGDAMFIRTFARQVKRYVARTKDMPDFMVDVFHRMRLHDTVELIDLVGDTNTVYNLEVEHEWLFDDKYYAKIDLTFDYDESVVIGGCCNNLT